MCAPLADKQIKQKVTTYFTLPHIIVTGWLHSTVGGTPVFGRRTDRPALSLQPTGDHYVGKPSATGQPTRPTQPFILPGSMNE